MAAAQTPAVGDGRGSTSPTAGHHVDTLDKPADYDPDVLGAYGLEYDGPRCSGDDCSVPVENDGDRCEECEAGAADEPDPGECTECGRDVSRPGMCFDCDVEASYVGGLAPRFGAQP